jgi:Capsule polysaccharide biosynthesis protein
MKDILPSKKLVIYAPYALWGPHFQTDLELAQEHLNQGYEVTILACYGELLTCFQNPDHRRSICRMCKSRIRKGHKWLGNKRVTLANFFGITAGQQKIIDKVAGRIFNSCQEVEDFSIKGVDVGRSALSSVISLLREPKPDIASHEELIKLNLVSAMRVYFSLHNYLSEQLPDKFILFNGRFAQLRPALGAARNLGIDTYVHERAGVMDRYSLTHNSSTHDIESIKYEINRISNGTDLDYIEQEKLAAEWYEERRNNKSQGWESFTTAQMWGQLPDLASDKVNLVIFNSSEDELEAFSEWRNPFYKDQNEGIERIIACLDTERFMIFLREHPNLTGIENTQTRRLRELAKAYPHLTVIAAVSPVSTYSLIDASDIVLTFGSTVGIEAVYREKPSFLMGRAFYENLGCCVCPNSHKDLIAKLNAFANGCREMLPKEDSCHRAVVRYGLFNKLWGKKFQNVKIYDLRTASMIRNGKEKFLRPSLISWLLFKGKNPVDLISDVFSMKIKKANSHE